MKSFVDAAQILETGTDIVSPHLRWLLRNVIIDHCGKDAINIISYHKDIPTDHWGEAIPLVKGIVINLQKHFEEAFEIVTSEKHPNVSIRFHIISNIIDTALHESHHLWAAHKHKNYEDPNIEQEESKAIAKSKLWLTAKNFDVEVFTFGTVIDTLLIDIIQSFREDITPPDNDPTFQVSEWKALQVFMWDNKLAFYDPEKEIKIGMRSLFEGQVSPQEAPWTDPPTMYTGESKMREAVISPDQTTVPKTTPMTTPIQQPLTQQPLMQQPIQQGPDIYTGEEEPVNNYSNQSQAILTAVPVEQTATLTMPSIAAPIQGHIPKEEIKTTAEKVLRTLFWHVVSKCEFNIEGGWNNPSAILEPVNISNIPHATQLFTHMTTVDENGITMTQVPCDGIIKGKLSAQQKLPMYELYLNMNGTLHKRTFIVQNNNKKDNQGNFTNWSTKARSGHIIMMFLEDKKQNDPPGKNNMRAFITLNPGTHLGQEEYKEVSR
jgi:hypothetical protein